MTEKTKTRETAETAMFWWKLFVVITTILTFLWVQFVGEGVRRELRDFLGITEISERLSMLERDFPAPKVVEWNLAFMRQEGPCTSERCVYKMVGSRTRYGEECGIPTRTEPVLRVFNQPAQKIEFRDFRPIQLSRQERSFDLPLRIPSTVPPGEHFFRVEVLYPTCQGVNEPLTRFTPWLKINVTRP